MALTRVSRHIIDEPLELQNINATGIGTFASLRVTGDLQVDGTTTTLDTVVTEVDKLEVLANNSTVAVAVTQSGSGDAAIFMGGNFGIGTNNPAYALDVKQTDTTNPLTIAAKGGTDGGGYFWESNSGTTYGAVGYGKLITANSGSANSAITTWGSQDLLLGTNRVERLRIHSSGKFSFGTGTASAAKYTFNSAGTNEVARFESTDTGAYLAIKDNSSTSINFVEGGGDALSLGVNSVEKLRITSDGKVRVPDNGKFVAGADDDLQIFHNTSHGLIENNTGSLYLFNYEDNQDIVLLSDNGSGGTNTYIMCDGSENTTKLYASGSIKLRTVSTGVEVNGNISLDDSSGTNDGRIKLGNGDDLSLYHNAANSFIDNTTGSLYIRGIGDDLYLRATDDIFIQPNGNVNGIIVTGGGAVELYHNNSRKLETTSTGISVTGQIDIGTTSIYGTGDISMGDSDQLRLGSGDDLRIFHDGSNNYIQGNTGSIILKNSTGDYFVGNVSNGAAQVYYNNSKKFETTTTGAKVTGALEVTQEYPSIRPTLDLNFAATKTLDRRITFTRDSVGTYVDENGLVKYASNNVPRFNHNPTTHESLGLLVEESRTNLLTYSDLLSGEGVGTGWANGGSTISKGPDVTAPDGTVSAWNTVYNGTSGDASLYKNGGEITTSNSTVYTLSVFAKVPSTNTYVTGIRVRTYNSNHSAQFNLVTGTIVGTTEGTTTNRMEAYPNGWYRCSITFTSGTDGNQGVQYYMMNPSNNTLLNDSNANGEALYLWGAQLEASAFPTSYIPTGSSAVTRDDDDAVIRGTNFSDIYNETEGTIFSEFNTKVNTGTTSKWAVSLRDPANNNNYIAVKTYAANMQALQVKSGGSSVADLTVSNSVVIDQFRRIAGSFKLNDFDAADGGTLLTGDTSGAMPTGITQMDIGRGWTSSNQKLEGHIKSIKYYRTKLPDAQLQGLTQQ